MDLDSTQQRVLRVLAHGRSNTNHICQQTGLGDEAVARTLDELGGSGLVAEVDRDLYASTPEGRAALPREYPAEAGFLEGFEVIHDAPAIKTVRLRGERRVVEVQVTDESVATLASALATVLAETHEDSPLRTALSEFAAGETGNNGD